MNKKLLLSSLSLVLMTGCSPNKPNTNQEYTGPVQTEETMTVEEKELFMIQQCINDYNNDLISEREEYYQIAIAPLPIEVSSLPEVQSLSDLEVFSSEHTTDNIVYQGAYTVQDPYQAVFTIYKPNSVSFWINADIEFIINPDEVTDNNGAFASVKQTLDQLLPNAGTILNTLYGINVSYDESTMTEDGYYLYTGPYGHTIDELKWQAESVYTYDFLQSAYYPAAFDGDHPIYKELNGQLYVYPNDELTDPYIKNYLTSKIVAVRDNGDTLDIDILFEYYEVIQSQIQRITLVKTENGYRLNESI